MVKAVERNGFSESFLSKNNHYDPDFLGTPM